MDFEYDSVRVLRGTTGEWAANDIVLPLGEVGFDITQNGIKIGDGQKKWSQLAFTADGTVVLPDYFLTWGYQDFASVTGQSLALSLDQNFVEGDFSLTDVSVQTGRPIVVLTSDANAYPYTSGFNIPILNRSLASKQVTATNTGKALALSGVPDATLNNIRVWYLYLCPKSQALKTKKLSPPERVWFSKLALAGMATTDDVVSLQTAISGKEPTIPTGTNDEYVAGDKQLKNFASDVLGSLLGGFNAIVSTLSTADKIVQTDDVITGFAKTQVQLDGKEPAIPTGTAGQFVRGDKTLGTLAAVATSGSFVDLTNKPTYSTVAFSGSYSDLLNKPTIPTVPTLATVATSGSYVDLSNKPAFATVAMSGSYQDLSDKPAAYSLPTASSTTLGGVKIGSWLSVTSDVVSVIVPDKGVTKTMLADNAVDISNLPAFTGQASDKKVLMSSGEWSKKNTNGWVDGGELLLRTSGGAGTFTPAGLLIQYRTVFGVTTVRYRIAALTSNASFPAGSYIYTLPAGLEFSSSYTPWTTAITPGTQLTATQVGEIMISGLPAFGSRSENTAGPFRVVVVPYSTTEFRLAMFNVNMSVDIQNTSNWSWTIAPSVHHLEFDIN